MPILFRSPHRLSPLHRSALKLEPLRRSLQGPGIRRRHNSQLLPGQAEHFRSDRRDPAEIDRRRGHGQRARKPKHIREF